MVDAGWRHGEGGRSDRTGQGRAGQGGGGVGYRRWRRQTRDKRHVRRLTGDTRVSPAAAAPRHSVALHAATHGSRTAKYVPGNSGPTGG